MSQHFKIPFAKFHGLGNDWIIVGGGDLSGSRSSRNPRALARRIMNRHEGVGADGLIVMLPPQDRQHSARVRFFNADGSEAEMSGNGIRCAAAFLLSIRGSLRAKGTRRPVSIETLAGVKKLETIQAGAAKWTFRVSMGAPVLEPKEIPFRATGARAPVVSFPLETGHGAERVTVTSMGNPHCSLFVDDFSGDWGVFGREIEQSPAFPNRTNVEFVKVVSRKEIEVRFWERGVGKTASSGTGSCGAAVASILNGLTERNVRVQTPAGVLEVSWPENGEVSLTGPAEIVATGEYYC